MTLSSNWKVKIFTTSLIKSWSCNFSSLIHLKGIKKFIIASAKVFGLEGQGGCKLAANILRGFDCISFITLCFFNQCFQKDYARIVDPYSYFCQNINVFGNRFCIVVKVQHVICFAIKVKIFESKSVDGRWAQSSIVCDCQSS